MLDRCTPLKRAIFQNEKGNLIRTEAIKNAYCMTRAALVEGLLAELPDDVIIFDHPCREIEFYRPDIDNCYKTQFQPNQSRRVQSVSFATGSFLKQDDIDLFIDATGWRSPLCRALNPGLKRPISRVREVVTSTHLPRLATQLGSSFVKTVLSEGGAAFGLLAPTSEHVIGFLQFDSERYDPPPHHATECDLRSFLQNILKNAPEPIPTYMRQADFSSAHVWHPINANMPNALHCDNAVAIGDAAHPLLPFTSQGISAALEDSIILGDSIRSLHGNRAGLPDMLKRFSENRRRDLTAFVEGGQRILTNFLDKSNEFVLPYLEGTQSKSVEPVSTPQTRLPNVFPVLANSHSRIGQFDIKKLIGAFKNRLQGELPELC